MGIWDRLKKKISHPGDAETPLAVPDPPSNDRRDSDIFNEKTPILGFVPPEEMMRAEAEARRRFPEFVSAFERREPGSTFFIKAPFGKGEGREHLWIDVELIHEGNIRGQITADPKRDIGYRSGDTVNVRVNDVTDWTYSEGKTRLGGFTIAVIKKAGAEE